MINRLTARDLGMVACRSCQLLCKSINSNSVEARCPRCNAHLSTRINGSWERTLAFLTAGLAFYIPANLLPCLHTDLLGQASESTILGGIQSFWNAGSYGIALLIFVASVLVPCGKFVGLASLLLAVKRGTPQKRQYTILYRCVEFIGYWSMLDVMVIGWASALAHFGTLSNAQPRIGILFFGCTVILTMLSAMSFDIRLLWDKSDGK